MKFTSSSDSSSVSLLELLSLTASEAGELDSDGKNVAREQM